MRNSSQGLATSRRTCRGRSRRPTRPAESWACPLGHDHAKVGRISWNAPKVCAGASSSSPGVDVLFADSARAFKSRRAIRTTVPVVRVAAKALRFFDRIAPWYDRINARLYQRQWLERVRAEMHGLRALDVGVWTGFTPEHLTASVGIDVPRLMLKRARYQGHLIRADVMDPPFRPRIV